MGKGWLFVFFITLAASLKFGDAVSAGNVAAKGCGGFVKSQKNIDFSTIEIVMETQTQNGNFAIFKPFNMSSIHFDTKKYGLLELHTQISSPYSESRSCLNSIFEFSPSGNKITYIKSNGNSK